MMNRQIDSEEDSPHDYYSEKDLADLEYLDMPAPKKGRLGSMILEEPISQLNAPKPIVLDVNDSVSKAIRLMRKFRYGSVLVVDKGELVGIFTEKDVFAKTSSGDVDLESLKLSEIMTSDPQSLEDDTATLAQALYLMAVGGYRHIPILKDGKPTGFCSIRGILRYISENALQEK